MTVDVIAASAGSGKTYALATEMEQAIEGGSARPDAIVAITYTNKAAAELSRRLRRRLLDTGRSVEAARIRDGYIGTIHSVCQRLIADLAFEAGSSPYPSPAPESYSARLFREVVGEVTAGALGVLGPLAEVLALAPDDSRSRTPYGAKSWRDALEKIVKAARENRLDSAVLRRSARDSAAELAGILDPPRGAVVARDAELVASLPDIQSWIAGEIAARIAKGKVPTARSGKQEAWVRKVQRTLDQGRNPPWTDLAAVLGSHWTSKAAQAITADLRATFAKHLSHPRFHEELHSILREVFAHAGEVSEAFVARKQAERLLDFEDMLAQAAEILSRAEARERLSGRIDLVMVDEFQDTSPVQLEVVMALSSLARRTVWVGDKKQAIFGFQGSDPGLMEAATDAVLQGQAPRVLPRNYRSRPPLVGFCSEVFAAAFERHGVPPQEVTLQPACPEPAALRGTPAIRLWLTTRDPNNPKARHTEAGGLARQVQALLANGALLVRESAGDPTVEAATRPVRAADIAVLARRNKDCRQIASALGAMGIPARVAEEGLGSTPEAGLLRSGLALLADARDKMAAAEIAWFTGSVPEPDGWLSDRIAAVAKSREEGTPDVAFPELAPLVALRAVAEEARNWTPEEAVLAVYDALDLPERVLGWPDPRRGFANLEALRAVARDYQDTCGARRSAATIAGLVSHLDGLSNDVGQALPVADDAVRVLTYHKAKGLEWPVVVCATLDTVFDTNPFGVRVEPAAAFEAAAPLEGREIRWWPWPYGAKSTGLELRDRADNTKLARRLAERAEAENARLLYVGFTRARDHLVLSARGFGRDPTRWLDQLRNTSGDPVLDLPWASPGLRSVKVGTRVWPCVVSEAIGTFPDSTAGASQEAAWFVRPQQRTTRGPQQIRPSSETLDPDQQVQVVITQVVSLGGRQDLKARKDDMASVGDALHGFLAADPGDGGADREAIATAHIERFSLAGKISLDTVLVMADRFHRWLEGHAPGPRCPEWPVRWVRDDGRVLSGDIDLLVPYGDGWLLIDHKSFPGDTRRRDGMAQKWAGQLSAYRAAVEAATGKPVEEVWVHLPVRGEVVRLEIPRPAQA